MKSKRYTFHQNLKELSSDDIAQYRDFDTLLEQYQQSGAPRPVGRSRMLYYISGAIAAAIALFLIYNNLFQKDTSQQLAEAYFEQMDFISPPLQNIKPSFANNRIDASKGGVYTHANGSRISVPAEAFVDQHGQPLSGEVDIKYREMHDFVDFFLSGIPMDYDSAGVKYQLESAGMVEIYAEQNGERVQIAPGKAFDVELVSEIKVPASHYGSVPKFNIYRLNTSSRNWEYKGQDNIKVLQVNQEGTDEPHPAARERMEALQKIDRAAQAQLAAIEASLPKPTAPLKPEKANPDAQVFDFNFKDSEIIGNYDPGNAARELEQTQDQIYQLRKQYENTLWQVASNNPAFDRQAAANINWEDMQLRRLNERDYELTLIAGDRRMTIFVKPVLAGKDYEKAMNEFNAAFEAYEVELAEQQTQLASQKEALAAQIEQEKRMANLRYEEQMDRLRQMGRDDEATDLMIKHKILNKFSASSFGIWNCDRPLPPFVVSVKGQFVDKKEKQYNHHTAFLVDKGKNTVFRFYTGKGSKIAYDSSSENLLWLVTSDNKLAVFRPEEFKRINEDKDDFTFVMDLVDKHIQTEQDVRQVLEF